MLKDNKRLVRFGDALQVRASSQRLKLIADRYRQTLAASNLQPPFLLRKELVPHDLRHGTPAFQALILVVRRFRLSLRMASILR
jgi:hypothetical protein